MGNPCNVSSAIDYLEEVGWLTQHDKEVRGNGFRDGCNYAVDMINKHIPKHVYQSARDECAESGNVGVAVICATAVEKLSDFYESEQ